MGNRKESGSYYTPPELVKFMVVYLKKEKQDFVNVLEPSAGDGRFLPLLLSCSNHVEAVELFQEKVQEIEQQYGCEKLTVECENFIRYASINDDRYSLIIGNPPYISLKTMNKADIGKAKKFCEEVGLPSSAMQNMWVAFVLASCKLLRPDGTLFLYYQWNFCRYSMLKNCEAIWNRNLIQYMLYVLRNVYLQR
ncbi:N-6 DNA methylase [Lachnospiraceae bacterium MD308]|jgi:adenine-specific DNA-methyltransferase|nr:N-6 DNA methylase [Lachnospiraceae bacterium MD308]